MPLLDLYLCAQLSKTHKYNCCFGNYIHNLIRPYCPLKNTEFYISIKSV